MRHPVFLDGEVESPQPSSGRGSTSTIKDLVAKVLKQHGLGSDPALRRVVAAWRDAAGSEFFEHTKVVSFKKGSLRVDVDSAALLQELSVYRKSELLEAVRRGEPNVLEIKFRLGARN